MKYNYDETLLSQQDLHERLVYDETTGILTWRVRPDNPQFNGRFAGKPAGAKLNDGYLQVQVNLVFVRAHRAIWMMKTGVWPVDLVDHIDGDKTNNRWANLRAATCLQNAANRGTGKSNTSGHKGVYWAKKSKAWRVELQYNYKVHRIGTFKDFDEAVAAYKVAEKEIRKEWTR